MSKRLSATYRAECLAWGGCASGAISVLQLLNCLQCILLETKDRDQRTRHQLSLGQEKKGGAKKEIMDMLLGYKEEARVSQGCPHVTKEQEIFR